MTALATRELATKFGTVRLAERPGDPTVSPLVFVHGYPDNLQIWSRVFSKLQTDRPLVAFDWPGLGHSQAYVGGATPFHLGRHFTAVIDALDFERVIPVGFDMGGHAVVAAAANDPDRVEQLVITNFLADGEVKTSWDIAVMRKLGLNRLVLNYAARIVFDRAQRTFLDGDSLSPEVRDDMWTGFRRSEVRTHLRRMCVGYQAALPRVTSLYPDLSMPVLVLWGDSDPHFPLAQAEAIATAAANASLIIIDGASHWLMWEHVDEFACHLARFVD